MNIALKGFVLFSILLIAGFGCTPSTPTQDLADNTIVAGDTYEDDVAMEQDDSMVDGDAIKNNNETMVEDENVMETNDTTMVGETTLLEGRYESYNGLQSITHAATRDVVLFFHASWCPTCKTLDKSINANTANIPDGLTILKTNYDTETELKKKYGVTYQHTLVQVDGDGNLIKKWSGGSTLDGVVKQVQ